MLADLRDTGEVIVLEEFDSAAEQEPVLSRTATGDLGDALYEAAATGGDFSKRALEGNP